MKEVAWISPTFNTQEPLPPQIPPQQKNHVRKENPSSEAMCKQQNLRGKKLIEKYNNNYQQFW